MWADLHSRQFISRSQMFVSQIVGVYSEEITKASQ